MLDDVSQPLHIRFLRVLADGVGRTGWNIAQQLSNTDELFRTGACYHTTKYLEDHGFARCEKKGGTHNIYTFYITKAGENEIILYDNGRPAKVKTVA